MSKEGKRQIAVKILPWAGLCEDVQIGPIVFWPWDPSRVQDAEIREQLEQFFKIFVDHHGNPVNSIVVCSHKVADFRVLEENEYKEIIAAINILGFLSICPEVKRAVCLNNNSIGPPCSEHFDFFGQKFKIPNDQGVVISTRNSMSWDSIDKVRVSKPLGVFNSWPIRHNEELINAFHLVFDTSFNLEVRQRLIRSLERFKLAHTEGNNVTDASRLVMMSTAFEILLDFPKNQKSRFFAEQIERRLKKRKSITEARTHKDKSCSYIKSAWWAYDFYQLRNKIVHGEQFNPEEGRYKDWISYIIVADLVFWELIIKELFEHNCLGEKAREWAQKYKNDSQDENSLKEFFLDFMMGFDDYHRALGWVSGTEQKI